MIHLEVDGKPIEVAENSTIMHATDRLGIHVPHFCYHRKLSIAANCRMCLVQVEKAPKPLPACATPVSEGMKVWTRSELAVNAQKGVMEFLLINHPLDCPICDQGGECQLQDLAVGYGASRSRYLEAKRVVPHKDLGPLVSADEMTRCIHCTRCVRFGQEIAGTMELGMAGRGEHAEIMAFVGSTVDSELSGNMIDVCPVGALTSKPFRYSARTWELARRRSIAPHDSLGSNLVVQVMGDRVMRVLPLENEEINECWLSDRDRFSYEGLNSAERLTAPMIKREGQWEECDWPSAIEYTIKALRRVISAYGASSVGALAAPQSTLEELYLLQKLMRGIGSGNVDFRLRQLDFSADGMGSGVPWLGMKVADLPKLDRVLLVGTNLRKEQPLLAHRIRQSVKHGAQLSTVNPLDDDLLVRVHGKMIVAPGALPEALAQIVKAATEIKGAALPQELGAVAVGNPARQIAESLASGERGAILLGNLAHAHPARAQLHALAQLLASLTGARFGFLGDGANSVGGYLVDALPHARADELDARAMLEQPRKAYLLLHAEVELDTAAPQAARAAMQSAEFVVAMSPYRHSALEYAQVLLPVAPFTESAGSFVNTEGRVQSFNPVVRPLAETRPAWKVLRVLGNLLAVEGFDFETHDELRGQSLAAAGDIASRLDNSTGAPILTPALQSTTLERIGEVPVYRVDAIVRRARSLQQTRDAQGVVAWLHGSLVDELGLQRGDRVRVRQDGGEAILAFGRDDRLPKNAVRVAAGCSETSHLGAPFGAISVERVAAQERLAI